MWWLRAGCWDAKPACLLLPVCPWASELTSLCLGSLIQQTGGWCCLPHGPWWSEQPRTVPGTQPALHTLVTPFSPLGRGAHRGYVASQGHTASRGEAGMRTRPSDSTPCPSVLLSWGPLVPEASVSCPPQPPFRVGTGERGGRPLLLPPPREVGLTKPQGQLRPLPQPSCAPRPSGDLLPKLCQRGSRPCQALQLHHTPTWAWPREVGSGKWKAETREVLRHTSFPHLSTPVHTCPLLSTPVCSCPLVSACAHPAVAQPEGQAAQVL